MKVCQLCAIDFTLQKFIIPLVDGMHEEGWDVHCVCSNGKFIPGLRHQGYKITNIEISRSINPFKHVLSVINLYRLFRIEKFDVVHVHTPVASLVGRFAAWLAGVPLIIYTAHGFYFHDEMPYYKKRVFIQLERFSGKITDFLFTQSSEDFQTAIDSGIIKPDKALSIGNGVNVEKYNPDKYLEHEEMQNSLAIPNDAFVVGMISRLVKEKGILEFLEAAENLHKDNSDIFFLLIGERLKSDHAQSVDKALELSKEKLGKNLILTGLRSDIPELISIMDVFCLPSWREGMPRTIIEAMMMQKPVIATDIRGSREEVDNNETGVLVPLYDSKKLAEAIIKLKSDPIWAAELGKAGRNKALIKYDESKIISVQIKKIGELASKNL